MNGSIIALIGVVLGWLLSQLTELVKSQYRISNLKENITLELKDIEMVLSENSTLAKKTIDSITSGSYAAYFSNPVKTPILDRYYIDVLPKYSANQRLNIRRIKDLITSLNDCSESLKNAYQSSNGRTLYKNAIDAIELYRFSLLAKAFLHEANRNGGQEEINDDHRIFQETNSEIDSLLKKINHLLT